MKKLFLLLSLAAFLFTSSQATTIDVDVNDMFFDPVSFSVQVGDTIKWTLVAGLHTTTSTSVPAGAATWNYAFTGPGDTYSYVVTVEGVYEYVCLNHPGMNGSFSTQVSLPFIEDFDYPGGENLTFHGWVAHSGAGSQPQTTVSPGLTFPGFPSSNSSSRSGGKAGLP